MDVRAPIEFAKGAFPMSTNHPLMLDEERHKVGTCYKEQGQNAAISLGHTLVSGQIKAQRIEAWQHYFQQHPDAYLYCFRGGLRSRLTQQWLKDAGLNIPYIEGGYKAMRQYLLNQIANIPTANNMLILSGITGSGKTDLLLKRSEAIDLEGIAHHRGSSFGKNVESQPTQINFENQLAVALLKHQHRQELYLLLEDESFMIGHIAIPKSFFTTMKAAKIIILKEADEQRLQRLLNEYVHKMHQGFLAKFGEEIGFTNFKNYLHNSMNAIQKRLGGQKHQEILMLIDEALAVQISQNTTMAHLAWIKMLLTHYYDPMYLYQINNKKERIIFEGNHEEVHEWLNNHKNNYCK